MYSSQDLERFYLEYQAEWVPRGMTIQSFCARNNVPYKVMERWIRDVHSKVMEVEVVGRPESKEPEAASASAPPKRLPEAGSPGEARGSRSGNIAVVVRIGGSTEITRRGLDYAELKSFIGKLEGLC